MEYGRLVVLGYSSYRVADVKPSSAPSSSSSSTPGSHQSHHHPEGRRGNQIEPLATATDTGDRVVRGEVEVHPMMPKSPRSEPNGKKPIGQFWEPIGDQNAQYVLQRRQSGNGVQLSRFHHFSDRTGASGAQATEIRPGGPSRRSSSELKHAIKRMMHEVEMKHRWDLGAAAGCKGFRDVKRPPVFLMCVPLNDQDANASITEYAEDPTTDMFQIGRMPCHQNDFVIPGPRVGASGTISRFAARVLCSREAPYECRIFAGGFDASRRMTTAGHAPKHCRRCGEWHKRMPQDHKCIHALMQQLRDDASNQDEADDDFAGETVDERGFSFEHAEAVIYDPAEIPIDGLTKNGVRVYLPEHKKWFEVSVNGNMYPVPPKSPSPPSSVSRQSTVNDPDTSTRHSAFNRPAEGHAGIAAILTDGAIIDLGGVQLQFLSRWGSQNPGEESAIRASMALYGDEPCRSSQFETSVVSKLEKLNVQCPVQLHTLRFRRSADEDIEFDQVPHVFPACGHVFGYEKRIAKSKMCPLCRTPGNFVRLLLKENFQLMSRAERTAIPECVLNPCGHAISSKLATHYSSILMPNGRAICPFCAVHLDSKTPFSRLYLYSEEGEDGDL